MSIYWKTALLCQQCSLLYNQQMLLLLEAQDIGFGNTGGF